MTGEVDDVGRGVDRREELRDAHAQVAVHPVGDHLSELGLGLGLGVGLELGLGLGSGLGLGLGSGLGLGLGLWGWG